MQTENEKAVRDSSMLAAWEEYVARYGVPKVHSGRMPSDIWQDAWQAALQSQVSNTDGWAFEEFRDWLRREMPCGTEIGDPDWWAAKIHCAMLSAAPKAPQQVSNTPQDFSLTTIASLRNALIKTGHAVGPSIEEFAADIERQVLRLCSCIESTPPQQAVEREGFENWWKEEQRGTWPECFNPEQKESALAAWMARADHSPATPTATASQESAPGQEAVAEVCPSTDGSGVLGVKWSSNPDVRRLKYGDKLYLALTPANAEAELEALISGRVTAAVEAFRRSAVEVLRSKSESHRNGGNGLSGGRFSEAAEIIQSLPGSTTELEKVCMQVAEEVFNSAGSFITEDEELAAIVRRVLDEKGE